MTAAVVAAPLLAALLVAWIAPQQLRRWLRIAAAGAAALAPLALAGRIDALSAVFAGLISLIAFFATVFSTGVFASDWGRGEAAWTRKPVYFVLLGAFWSAMLLVVVATDFTLLWFGIACTTLTTALLVGFTGDAPALEAAWKYLVLCSVGIGLALAGTILVGRAALDAGLSPANALQWHALAALGVGHASQTARIGLAIVTLGFATKAGLVPLHAWLPDAHSKAPAPVSALLSGVLVSCSLYALMRVLDAAAGLGAGDEIRRLLLWLGGASALTAGILMLGQRDLKRLLAYSTVEHAGIVALALGFGGPLGRFAALVHVTAHAFAKASGFFAAGMVQHERGTTALAELRGLWHSGASGKLLLGALTALGGLPPFGLFASELLVVIAGVAAHQWTALGIGCLGMALAFAALARAAIECESGRPHVQRSISRFSLAAAAGALTCALAVAVLPWVVPAP